MFVDHKNKDIFLKLVNFGNNIQYPDRISCDFTDILVGIGADTSNIIYLMKDFTNEAVQDTGGSNYDAVLNANTGSYSYDGATQTLTLIGDASADSTFVPLTDSEWTLVGTYGVDVGSGLFNMYALNYKGDGTCDVWYADQTNQFSLAAEDTGLLYTVPALLSLSSDLNLPKIPTATIAMSDYDITTGETATVTVTFDTIVTGVELTDFAAGSGKLSNLVKQDDYTYTMTFTPNVSTISATNTIDLLAGSVTDRHGNANTSIFSSQNYSVETYVNEIKVSFGYLTPSSNVSINALTDYTAITAIPLVDVFGAATAITLTNSKAWSNGDSTTVGRDAVDGFLKAAQNESCWYLSDADSPLTVTIDGLDSAGTYDIKIGGNAPNPDVARNINISVNGTTPVILDTYSSYPDSGFTFAGITGVTAITIDFSVDLSNYPLVAGIDIIRTA